MRVTCYKTSLQMESSRKRKLNNEDSSATKEQIGKAIAPKRKKAVIETSIIDLDDSSDNSEPEFLDAAYKSPSKTKSRSVKKTSAVPKVTKKAPVKRTAKKKVITVDPDAVDDLPDVDIDIDDSVFPMWDASTVLANLSGVSHDVAANFVQLIQDDNTLPFIARYRKSMVGNMTPEG